MKVLWLCILMAFATNAFASEATRKALIKEQQEAQEGMHECAIALADAIRHNNEWRNDHLSLAECKARAYEFMDIGQRMMSESLKEDEE